MQNEYDVVIIGAGITGACVLHELAKYQLRIAVIDRENDVAEGTTKANSAIVHAGYDPHPGTKMAFHNVRGCAMYPSLCEEFSVPYKNCGSLVLSFKEEDDKLLEELYHRGRQNGVPGLRILTKDELLKREPNLNHAVRGALYAPTAGIVNPWQLCIALAEHAVENGADALLGHAVTFIEKTENGYQLCLEGGSSVKTKYLVNAAGIYADAVHAMLEEPDFSITAGKGQYYLFDQSEGNMVHEVIFQCPNELGKGVLVSPTVDGNLIIGPDRVDSDQKEDLSTSADGLAYIRKAAALSCDKLDYRKAIRNFAGLRAITGKEDFIIREVTGFPGFIELAGIQSPGLTSAPSIALEAVELLKNAGLALEPKERLTEPKKPVRMKTLSIQEQSRMIEQNPLYGRIICRCESITEGEIVDALKSPIAPPTIDAVKRRTSAGMGRCQGGFCSPRVLHIIARERGIAPEQVLKDKAGSYILLPNDETEVR